MLTADEIAERRQQVAQSPDLTSLLQRLSERARPVLDRMPVVPAIKAMLSVDGGICPDDRVRLQFDPWNPNDHRCPVCARVFRGERHEAAWAHYQHLWLAERTAHLATLAALGDRSDAAARANALLQAYRLYGELPNRDNVLGPSHLFFSTYLESIWITNYLAAAALLREVGALADETAEVVNSVADEAANLIGEFDEGMSNRQTWNNAALGSIAVWFEDEDLATRAIHGSSGMLAHLLHGFGPDGMWFEGDNYHLFALRGELVALGWARQAGVDVLADARLSARLAALLRAPTLTALPDFTFPARKDSRFGVSLAQPMYLELWEIGLARLQATGSAPAEQWSWLRELYQIPAPEAQLFESYLHETGEPAPRQPRARADLSWWSLLEIVSSLPPDTPPFQPNSIYLDGQGLAILRRGRRYVGLECGPSGGGHGHPDRLNLTLHAEGEYWLPDFGTGSYVSRDLFWYRSTLAHNAPRLDGVSQPIGDASCENFEQTESWSWARGQYGDCTRSVIAGPDYVLDVLELSSRDDHVLELPLHLIGRIEVEPQGRWETAQLPDEFVRDAEQFRPESDRPVLLRACGRTGVRLAAHLLFSGDLLRAQAPGFPGSTDSQAFYLLRGRGRSVRFVTLFEAGPEAPKVRLARSNGGIIEVHTVAGVEQHLGTVQGWEVRTPTGTVQLGGPQRKTQPFVPLVSTDRPLVASGVAVQVASPPLLDGTLEGFDLSEPLELDHDDQYRRSEEPYPGPEEFSARAFLNWDDQGLYLAVEVLKPEVFARDPAARPLKLDNEPDEIHADGVQVYVQPGAEAPVYGVLLVPSSLGSDLIVRPVAETGASREMVEGVWQATDTGYMVTARILLPEWGEISPELELGFDLLVNHMTAGRRRRAGQLVWSGGGGWVWLRGDRQDPARFGTLVLR